MKQLRNDTQKHSDLFEFKIFDYLLQAQISKCVLAEDQKVVGRYPIGILSVKVDVRNLAVREGVKEHMVVAIFDDVSDLEKNLQMYGLKDPRDLMTRPSRITEFDTEKAERLVKSLGKFISKL